MLAACARTSTPPASFQPFHGAASVRVTVKGTADETDALVDRLAAVGVRTKSKGTQIELYEVRDPDALVRALLKPDWWKVSLVAPEPPKAPSAADSPGTLFGDIALVETPMPLEGAQDEAPFWLAAGPERDAVAQAAGDPPFVMRCDPPMGCKAYGLRGAPWATAADLRSASIAPPPVEPTPSPDGKKPPEPTLTLALDPKRLKELNRLVSENVGRPLVFSVAGEALLFAPVRMSPNALAVSLALRDLSADQRYALTVAMGKLLATTRPTGAASVEKVEPL